MNTMIKNKNLFIALVVASMAVLPGCDWLKKRGCCGGAGNDELVQQGEMLASLDGKTIISDKSLERDFEQLLEENPQLRQVLPLMPDAKTNFLQGMVSQAVVDQYVVDNKINQQEDYQAELSRMTRSVERMLNTKYFSLAHPINVSDEDAKKYYEDNKATMPDLMISRGGVKAEGVAFTKEADAKAFAAKTQGKCCFQKMAREDGLKLQDFKVVNAESAGVNPALRQAISSVTTVPSVQVVKADGKVWVVNSYEKIDPQYRPFEQVANGIKQFVEKEQRMAMFDKEITQLKEQYHVVVNEEPLKAKKETDAATGQEQCQADAASETVVAEAAATEPSAAQAA